MPDTPSHKYDNIHEERDLEFQLDLSDDLKQGTGSHNQYSYGVPAGLSKAASEK
jgi:hypothetical protein